MLKRGRGLGEELEDEELEGEEAGAEGDQDPFEKRARRFYLPRATEELAGFLAENKISPEALFSFKDIELFTLENISILRSIFSYQEIALIANQKPENYLLVASEIIKNIDNFNKLKIPAKVMFSGFRQGSVENNLRELFFRTAIYNRCFDFFSKEMPPLKIAQDSMEEGENDLFFSIMNLVGVSEESEKVMRRLIPLLKMEFKHEVKTLVEDCSVLQEGSKKLLCELSEEELGVFLSGLNRKIESVKAEKDPLESLSGSFGRISLILQKRMNMASFIGDLPRKARAFPLASVEPEGQGSFAVGETQALIAREEVGTPTATLAPRDFASAIAFANLASPKR